MCGASMRAMEIGRILEEAGIPVIAEDAGAIGDRRIYTVKAPDRERCDKWLARLNGLEHGLFPVVLGTWMLEDDDRGRLVDDERASAIVRDARDQLASLDRWRVAPDPTTGPHRVRAVLAWREAHTEGAALETLIAALATPPKAPWSMPPPREAPAAAEERVQPFLHADDVRIGLFPVAAGHEVLAHFGFGHWNACPPSEHHVACAMRWERDLGARLVYLTHDAYAYAVSHPPESDHDVLRVIDEHAQLSADERPPKASLRSSGLWYFWWD